MKSNKIINESQSDLIQVYREDIEKEAIVVRDKKILSAKKREYLPYGDYVIGNLQRTVSQIVGCEVQDIQFGFPPENFEGDLSLSTYDLAKNLKIKPQEIVKKIIDAINSNKSTGLFETAAAAGPYINFTLNRKKVYELTLAQIGKLGEKYGESDVNRGKVGIIDFSSPNIAKPMGVGHLRSTIIGNSIYKLYEATGYQMIRDNHLGDWGTQFGKLVWAFRKWGSEKDLEKDPIRFLNELYIKFHSEAENNPQMEDEARDIFKKLEDGDAEVVSLWNRFRELSIKEFKETYKLLDVDFDLEIGESFYADQSDKVIRGCVLSGACKEEGKRGLVVCEVSDSPSFLLRKEDGSSLYATRDLATIKFREKVFNPDVILYVVGQEQGLYFKQVFGLAKKVGYARPNTELKHLGFGMVLGSDGKKMSTRKGSLVELGDLIDRSREESLRILTEKYPDTSKKELSEIAEAIGTGAIAYNDLKQAMEHNISFDWNRMLDFKGGSAVFLQYACVRIKSILAKVKTERSDVDLTKTPKEIKFEEKEEFELLKKLMFLPNIIARAQKADSPHFIRIYIEEVTDAFSRFYEKVSIINTHDKVLLESRILLVSATGLVLKKGLDLLNVKVPAKL